MTTKLRNGLTFKNDFEIGLFLNTSNPQVVLCISTNNVTYFNHNALSYLNHSGNIQIHNLNHGKV